MANKTDGFIVLNDSVNYECFLHEFFDKVNLFYFTYLIYIL